MSPLVRVQRAIEELARGLLNRSTDRSGQTGKAKWVEEAPGTSGGGAVKRNARFWGCQFNLERKLSSLFASTWRRFELIRIGAVLLVGQTGKGRSQPG